MVDVKTEKASFSGEDDPGERLADRPVSFSLAHLSDLHLTTLVNIKPPHLFSKRLLGYFSWLHKRRRIHRLDIVESLLDDLRALRPDHTAVTGDLTHLGLPMEYVEVRQWLPYLGSPEHVTVIPGNHEAYSGCDWFKSCHVWGPYMDSNTSTGLPKSSAFFPSLRIFGQVALIGVCSARPSLPLLATGTLGREQITALEGLLQQTSGKDLLRVILIHHPPVQGSIKWRKRLTDSEPFAKVIARHGAELILHGHAHAPSLSELRTPTGYVPVIGAASGSEMDPASGRCAKYNIYRISRVGSAWSVTMSVRRYAEEQKGFVAEAEKSLTIPPPAP